MRDPTAGAGLVIVQGRQHSFGLEGVWKSDALPRPGIVVDVEFDDAGRVTAMRAVPEARLAREQAEAAIALATAKGAGFVTRLGLPHLAALGLLALGWIWLPTLTVDGSVLGQWNVTLWKALGALNSGEPLEALRSGARPTAGVYGLGALTSLAAPLVAALRSDRRLHLAALLPLGYMLAMTMPLVGLVRQTTADTDVVSLGAGAYVSLLAGIYVANVGVKRFFLARAHDAAAFYEKG